MVFGWDKSPTYAVFWRKVKKSVARVFCGLSKSCR